MRILELKLFNFRQFYKESSQIAFATSEDKNITLIHGNNGSGKTALLNAFTWLLYESFTEALQAPEYFVNNRAIKEANVDNEIICWVLLLFEHNGKKYRIKRTQTIRKLDEHNTWTKVGESVLELQWASENDGEWQIDKSPNEVIGRILPKDLHRYFFLDAERIEALQRPGKKDEVVSATKMFIGEEILIRAHRHLKQASDKLEAELKQFGDIETQTLIIEKENLNKTKLELGVEINNHIKNIKGYDKVIKSIEESLRNQNAVHELQKRRDDLKKQQDELQDNQSIALSELSSIISSSGYKMYLRNAIDNFREIINELEKRGELPSSIKTPFVKELLDRGKCICGTDLIEGEECFNKVKEWLDKSGLSTIEETAIRIKAEIDQLEREAPTVFNRIERENNTFSQCKEQLSNIQEELDRISDRLTTSKEESIRDLEIRKQDAEKKRISESGEITFKEDRVNKIDERIEEINKEITKRESKNTQHELAKKRFNACNESIKVIEQIRALLRENFRQDLNDRIKKIFAEISFKPYVPLLDIDYSLKLLENEESSIVVGASTGENQILTLSFIGAIIDQARLFSMNKDRLPGPDNSKFPILLDSPFGYLDPIYKRHIATKIPLIADQVVLFLSKSQWQGEVEVVTSNKIGKEYIIEYFTPKKDAEESKIELKGKTYNLVKRTTDEFENVEIVEVI